MTVEQNFQKCKDYGVITLNDSRSLRLHYSQTGYITFPVNSEIADARWVSGGLYIEMRYEANRLYPYDLHYFQPIY